MSYPTCHNTPAVLIYVTLVSHDLYVAPPPTYPGAETDIKYPPSDVPPPVGFNVGVDPT